MNLERTPREPWRLERRAFMRCAALGAAGAALGAGPAPEGARASGPAGVEIANASLRVTVSPGDGASLLAFQGLCRGRWLNLYPDTRAAAGGLRQASWMMLPYSNRIRNGAFSFAGKAYQLRNGQRHAIHGDARTRPWTVAEQSASHVRLTLRSADFADFNWPWPIEAEASFRVEGARFLQTLRLRNCGTTAMPAGFGWHPFYPRALTRESEPVRMQMKWGGVYPDADGDCLPEGPMQPLPPDLDYASAKAVPLDRRYDTCLGGYDGRGFIEWPESGVRLTYTCSPNVTHFVYYNPTDRPYFAAEPVSHVNNGVNHLAQGWAGHGVQVLPAGAALEASFETALTALA